MRAGLHTLFGRDEAQPSTFGDDRRDDDGPEGLRECHDVSFACRGALARIAEPPAVPVRVQPQAADFEVTELGAQVDFEVGVQDESRTRELLDTRTWEVHAPHRANVASAAMRSLSGSRIEAATAFHSRASAPPPPM